jgi:hydrogenase maturation protease
LSKVTLIGVGNKFRCDDAVGLIILRKLQRQIPPSIETIEASGEGLALMDAWYGAETVYLFDAVRSGCEVGAIARIDALVQSVPAKYFNYSTHAFGVAEAVELSRTLNQLPAKLIIYGVEGKNFAIGIGISPEVEQAAEEVGRRVLSELENMHEEVMLY